MARNGGNVFRFLLILGTGLVYLSAAGKAEEASMNIAGSASVANCERALEPLAVKEALGPLCQRAHATEENLSARNTIIVGFVGGFADPEDLKHPEVSFAALLRERYPSTVHAEVFANHEGNKALHRVLQLMDSNNDSVISAGEKEQANVIIYGHSWGGSQTLALARALEEYGIPVQLTIQLDSVHKPGQEDSTVPPNVKRAINLYQTKGPIHGRRMIRAADPEKTNIVGNIQMTYRDRQINCDNYPWLPRHFNKPHHKIENDPQVWDRVASMIDSEILKPTPTADVHLASR